MAYFLVYVDDIILTGNNTSFLDKFVTVLDHRFSIKDLGALHHFLGVEVVPTSSSMFLSQGQYLADILNRFKMEGAKEVSMPMASDIALQANDSRHVIDATNYRRLISLLQYLLITRPVVAYVVNKLSQYMHAPNDGHWQAAKRVLRYLKAFSDSDWGNVNDNGRSTTAYIVYLGTNIISWKSARQKTVSRSSTEAEYRALAHAHVALDYFFVRDMVADGSLSVCHVSSHDQVVDMLTKPLGRVLFQRFRSKIGVTDGSSILRGRVKQ
ncbi:PREDICTED: uncharacterized protein LOC109159826 [Ipomoea nil]|uniref:uncharacterized protein LOC109159826 n=1 Tax=Ipomoea nil TaxID=35883 RepID=UPI000901CC98|nr:PREDICTED: uncharacterized protein LOC109159826 [Ipomoea nil]